MGHPNSGRNVRTNIEAVAPPRLHTEDEARTGTSPPRTCAEATAATRDLFSPGDVVALVSGGLPMTVESVAYGEIGTVWFDLKGELLRDEFHPTLLRPSQPLDERIPF